MLFSSISCLVNGQSIIGTIKLPSHWRYKQLNCFAIGNNVAYSFDMQTPNRTTWDFVSEYIDANGKNKSLNISKNEFDQVLGTIMAGPDIARIYFAERKGKITFIKHFDVNLKTGSKIISSNEIELPNIILGVRFTTDRLIFYSTENNKPILNVLTIDLKDSVSRVAYPLPIDISEYRKTDMSFVPGNSPVSISQALDKIKLMVDDRKIILSVDEYINVLKKPGTLIYELDLATGETTKNFITEPLNESSQSNFRSFVCENFLFRTISQAKTFTLKVFSRTTGELVSTKVVERDPESYTKVITVRNDNDPPTRDKHLPDITAFGYLLVPFVTAARDSVGEKFILLCGTNKNVKVRGPIGLTPAALITSIIMTTVKQLSDNSGLSKYFYFYGNAKEGFEFHTEDPLKGVQTQIDTFELTTTSDKSKFRYKAIASHQSEHGIIGIYEDKVENDIKVVEFTHK